ncbi:MAG: hypothetical protein EHM36_00705 [Deltaproteobacteria bacterium]|nr:MAG: hypothetical protein EHM36_00705 [Deltaproteobacteria bacterium]
MAKTTAKGTIQFVELKKRDGKADAYWIVVDGTKYWDSKGNFKDHKAGDIIDFEWEANADGTFKFINPVGGGGFKGGGKSSYVPSKDESFAASYCKDIAIALINKGTISTSHEIDATLIHYFNLFMGQLKGAK